MELEVPAVDDQIPTLELQATTSMQVEGCLVISADGSRFLTLGPDRNVSVYDRQWREQTRWTIPPGEPYPSGKAREISGISATRDFSRIAFVDYSEIVRTYDWQGNALRTLQIESETGVTDVAWSPAADLLFCTHGDMLEVRRADTHEILATHSIEMKSVYNELRFESLWRDDCLPFYESDGQGGTAWHCLMREGGNWRTRRMPQFDGFYTLRLFNEDSELLVVNSEQILKFRYPGLVQSGIWEMPPDELEDDSLDWTPLFVAEDLLLAETTELRFLLIRTDRMQRVGGVALRIPDSWEKNWRFPHVLQVDREGCLIAICSDTATRPRTKHLLKFDIEPLREFAAHLP